jgi:hypothetical protein
VPPPAPVIRPSYSRLRDLPRDLIQRVVGLLETSTRDLQARERNAGQELQRDPVAPPLHGALEKIGGQVRQVRGPRLAPSEVSIPHLSETR